ncbi:DUF4163 domain-containing protein [Novosphingobium terrae]|uniref:DUF4163 domain-containing protein n=1 Tax=Novosphingobium terrae TaxID=2726189 RepID=UPI001F13CDB3|nr:DUF4163 domain-containing protein [Novosphingobium terrae]
MRVWQALAMGAITACLAASTGLAAPAKILPPGRSISIANPLYSFDYEYPAAAGRIPALKAWLDKDAANHRSNIAGQAKDARDEARKDKITYISYDSSTGWQVVTDLPGWLSLSGMEEEFTGGAHPNHGPTALLWNKKAGRQVKALDMFDTAALSAAIQAPFCAALNKEREERRGEPVKPDSTDDFDACIDPLKEVLILGSADHAHFTRIGILIGPYEAGPYAEGDYDITLKVTPEVLAAVKPAWRSAFAVSR